MLKPENIALIRNSMQSVVGKEAIIMKRDQLVQWVLDNLFDVSQFCAHGAIF